MQVTRQTAAPSATYLAIVAPLLIVSSSGWACTNISRRPGSDVTSGLTAPPYAAGDVSLRNPSHQRDHPQAMITPRLGEVARRNMCRLPVRSLDQHWFVDAADLLGLPAAGVEPACLGGLAGLARHRSARSAREVAHASDRASAPLRAELGVRVGRPGVDLVLVADLGDLAEIKSDPQLLLCGPPVPLVLSEISSPARATIRSNCRRARAEIGDAPSLRPSMARTEKMRESLMPKLIVLYPPPTDAEVFERRYRLEHGPMVMEKVPGMTKFLACQVLGTPSELLVSTRGRVVTLTRSNHSRQQWRHRGQATVAYAMEISPRGDCRSS